MYKFTDLTTKCPLTFDLKDIKKAAQSKNYRYILINMATFNHLQYNRVAHQAI